MLDKMSGRQPGRVRVGVIGVTLTALAGEWLSHTLEYVRLWGWHRAFDSVHVYMGPIGAALVVAAVAGVYSTIRLARSLEWRLAELRRVQPTGSCSPSPASPRSMSVPALMTVVWVMQFALYLLQENLEFGVGGHGAPGLSVVRGAHALAPVVHLAVALALVACLWLARRQVTRLGHEVWLVEARLDAIRRPAAAPRPCPPARAWTPVDRWGMQLWSRPPPAPRVA